MKTRRGGEGRGARRKGGARELGGGGHSGGRAARRRALAAEEEPDIPPAAGDDIDAELAALEAILGDEASDALAEYGFGGVFRSDGTFDAAAAQRLNDEDSGDEPISVTLGGAGATPEPATKRLGGAPRARSARGGEEGEGSSEASGLSEPAESAESSGSSGSSGPSASLDPAGPPGGEEPSDSASLEPGSDSGDSNAPPGPAAPLLLRVEPRAQDRPGRDFPEGTDPRPFLRLFNRLTEANLADTASALRALGAQGSPRAFALSLLAGGLRFVDAIEPGTSSAAVLAALLYVLSHYESAAVIASLAGFLGELRRLAGAALASLRPISCPGDLDCQPPEARLARNYLDVLCFACHFGCLPARPLADLLAGLLRERQEVRAGPAEDGEQGSPGGLAITALLATDCALSAFRLLAPLFQAVSPGFASAVCKGLQGDAERLDAALPPRDRLAEAPHLVALAARARVLADMLRAAGKAGGSGGAALFRNSSYTAVDASVTEWRKGLRASGGLLAARPAEVSLEEYLATAAALLPPEPGGGPAGSAGAPAAPGQWDEARAYREDLRRFMARYAERHRLHASDFAFLEPLAFLLPGFQEEVAGAGAGEGTARRAYVSGYEAFKYCESFALPALVQAARGAQRPARTDSLRRAYAVVLAVCGSDPSFQMLYPRALWALSAGLGRRGQRPPGRPGAVHRPSAQQALSEAFLDVFRGLERDAGALGAEGSGRLVGNIARLLGHAVGAAGPEEGEAAPLGFWVLKLLPLEEASRRGSLPAREQMFLDVFMLTLFSGAPRAGLAAYGDVCEGESWAAKCFQPLLSPPGAGARQGQSPASERQGRPADAETRELLGIVRSYARGAVRLLESEGEAGKETKEAKRFMRAAALVFSGSASRDLVLRRARTLLVAVEDALGV